MWIPCNMLPELSDFHDHAMVFTTMPLCNVYSTFVELSENGLESITIVSTKAFLRTYSVLQPIHKFSCNLGVAK